MRTVSKAKKADMHTKRATRLRAGINLKTTRSAAIARQKTRERSIERGYLARDDDGGKPMRPLYSPDSNAKKAKLQLPGKRTELPHRPSVDLSMRLLGPLPSIKARDVPARNRGPDGGLRQTTNVQVLEYIDHRL